VLGVTLSLGALELQVVVKTWKRVMLRRVWCRWLLVLGELGDGNVLMPMLVMAMMMVMVVVMVLWLQSLRGFSHRSQRHILTEVFIFQCRERAVSTFLFTVSNLNGLLHVREL